MRRHPYLVPAATSLADEVSVQPRVRVVLAEDHASMRRSLRMLLENEADIQVVAEAGELTTAIGHVHGYSPEVLVLDLRMQDRSSVEAIRRVRAQAPDTEVVAITMQEDPAFAKQALDAGAVGFVLKDRADVELPQAVRCAARGEMYTSPRVTPGLAALRRR